MIKTKVHSKRAKTLNNLEKDIIEQEKELNALKKAFELNDVKALNVLPMKYMPKTIRHSKKIPKLLNEEINEKRKELKKLEEIEELNKIQMTLFNNIKTQRNKNYKLNPISQRGHSNDNKKYYQTEDYFAINLNKECEKILGDKKNNNRKINLNNTTNEWKIQNNYNKNKFKKFERFSYRTKYVKEFKKEMDDLDKIINVNNNKNNYLDSDEEKDREFLNKLDKNLKIFYLSKTQTIFEFLKSINLCRYIQHFLNEGVDLFEEFLSLPKDFFDKMTNSFLNQKQIDKLFKKISSYKNTNNSPKRIAKNESGCNTRTITKKKVDTPTPKINIDNSSNFSMNNSTLLIKQDEFICCWNCLKPLKKTNAILKEYNNNLKDDDNSVIFKYKYFCSEICVNKFENEKNIKNNIENNIDKNENENNYNINKDNSDANINNIIDINKNVDDNNEEDIFEGDNYDPMEDF